MPFLTCSLLYTFYSIIFSSISLSLQISFYTSLSYSSICSNHNIHNYLFFIACKPNNFRQFCLSLFINLLIYWNLNAIHALPFLTCSLLYTFYSIIFSSISLSLQISFYTSLSYSSICSIFLLLLIYTTFWLSYNIHQNLFIKPNIFLLIFITKLTMVTALIFMFFTILLDSTINYNIYQLNKTCSKLITFLSFKLSYLSLKIVIHYNFLIINIILDRYFSNNISIY